MAVRGESYNGDRPPVGETSRGSFSARSAEVVPPRVQQVVSPHREIDIPPSRRSVRALPIDGPRGINVSVPEPEGERPSDRIPQPHPRSDAGIEGTTRTDSRLPGEPHPDDRLERQTTYTQASGYARSIHGTAAVRGTGGESIEDKQGNLTRRSGWTILKKEGEQITGVQAYRLVTDGDMNQDTDRLTLTRSSTTELEGGGRNYHETVWVMQGDGAVITYKLEQAGAGIAEESESETETPGPRHALREDAPPAGEIFVQTPGPRHALEEDKAPTDEIPVLPSTDNVSTDAIPLVVPTSGELSQQSEPDRYPQFEERVAKRIMSKGEIDPVSTAEFLGILAHRAANPDEHEENVPSVSDHSDTTEVSEQARPTPDTVVAHLKIIAMQGSIRIDDPRHGAHIGTSIENVIAMIRTGTLHSTSSQEGPGRTQGDISVHPTRQLQDEVQASSADQAGGVLEAMDDPEGLLEATKGDAKIAAYEHAIKYALGVSLSDRGLDPWLHQDDSYPLEERRIPLELASDVEQKAGEREGIALGISPRVFHDKDTRLMSGAAGTNEVTIRTTGEGISYRHISGIEPCGPVEEQFVHDLRATDNLEETLKKWERPLSL